MYRLDSSVGRGGHRKKVAIPREGCIVIFLCRRSSGEEDDLHTLLERTCKLGSKRAYLHERQVLVHLEVEMK